MNDPTFRQDMGLFDESINKFTDSIYTFQNSVNKLITAMGMQAENEWDKYNGYPITHNIESFKNLMRR